MALASLGTASSDSSKTPTLRQLWKYNNGEVDEDSRVTIVFSPGKYKTYTLVSEAGFRVQIAEDLALYRFLEENVEKLAHDCSSLHIAIVDGTKGSWELNLETDEICQWDERNWGWKLDVLNDRKPEPTTTKSPRKAK